MKLLDLDMPKAKYQITLKSFHIKAQAQIFAYNI